MKTGRDFHFSYSGASQCPTHSWFLNPLLHSSFPSPSSGHITGCPSSWERHLCSVLSVNSLGPHLPNCPGTLFMCVGTGKEVRRSRRMQPPAPAQEQAFSSQPDLTDYRPYLIPLSNFSLTVLIIMISSSSLCSNITLDSQKI